MNKSRKDDLEQALSKNFKNLHKRLKFKEYDRKKIADLFLNDIMKTIYMRLIQEKSKALYQGVTINMLNLDGESGTETVYLGN